MARLLCFILVKTNAKIYRELITSFKITSDMKTSITVPANNFLSCTSYQFFSKMRVEKIFAGICQDRIQVHLRPRPHKSGHFLNRVLFYRDSCGQDLKPLCRALLIDVVSVSGFTGFVWTEGRFV